MTVDAKGKRSKKYETYQTPHERLKSLVNADKKRKYLREGVSLEALAGIAAKQTDNEFARMMQEAKDRLFKKLGAARALMGTRIRERFAGDAPKGSGHGSR